MKRITRRNFLKVAGVGAAALGLAACGLSLIHIYTAWTSRWVCSTSIT